MMARLAMKRSVIVMRVFSFPSFATAAVGIPLRAKVLAIASERLDFVQYCVVSRAQTLG